jgi:hypothetical protein
MIFFRNFGLLLLTLYFSGCVTNQQNKLKKRPWQRPSKDPTSTVPMAPKAKAQPSGSSNDSGQSIPGGASTPAVDERHTPSSALDHQNHSNRPLTEGQPVLGRVTGATTPAIEQTSECFVVPGFVSDAPFYLPKTKVFITKITKQCLTNSGARGVLKGSGFIAMGLPCTGGEGRIDWKGTNYLAPKMLSFLVDTNCPMFPTDPQTAKLLIVNELGLPNDATLLAFNPFSIQYWEIQGHEDADVSFAIEVRSNKGIGPSWQAFQKETPYRLTLVGRENAFGQGKHMFVFEAEIRPSVKNRFKTNVLQGRVVNSDESTQIKARCMSLKPDRDCAAVF